MQKIQFDGANINNKNLYTTPVQRKIKPRKWREIENVKAQMVLAKELREIDPSFSFSESELV